MAIELRCPRILTEEKCTEREVFEIVGGSVVIVIIGREVFEIVVVEIVGDCAIQYDQALIYYLGCNL